MWVEPVRAGVGDHEPVRERISWRDRRLSEVRHPIHVVDDGQSMPMDRGRLGQCVLDGHFDKITGCRLKQFAGDSIGVPPRRHHGSGKVEVDRACSIRGTDVGLSTNGSCRSRSRGLGNSRTVTPGLPRSTTRKQDDRSAGPTGDERSATHQIWHPPTLCRSRHHCQSTRTALSNLSRYLPAAVQTDFTSGYGFRAASPERVSKCRWFPRAFPLLPT